jgi:hypothetical protein
MGGRALTHCDKAGIVVLSAGESALVPPASAKKPLVAGVTPGGATSPNRDPRLGGHHGSSKERLR